MTATLPTTPASPSSPSTSETAAAPGIPPLAASGAATRRRPRRSPWQRGTNENTNRLLRFWFEKGTDLSRWSPSDLQHVQATLNARPRPTLDLKTPAQALAQLLEQAA